MKQLLLATILAVAFAGSADAKPHKKHKKIKSRSAKTALTHKVTPKSSNYSHYSTGSYVLFDYNEGQFSDEFNRNQVRSIASITKMFTAITVINSTANLYEKLYVTGHNGGKVPRGTYVSRMDLLKAMVMNSDNLAAEVLANNHPGGFNQFIIDANTYNRNIGLVHTEIVDSSGIMPGNVSTASELVLFLNSIKDNTIIQDIGAMRQYEMAVPKGQKTYYVKFHNTNPELYKYDNILISKTGFTNAAGRCVMMLVEKGQKMYALIVLGQPNIQRRSQVVSSLM
jgi:D-alanyl-D-alanine endopeptidase (penicillin-binding protein 7)